VNAVVGLQQMKCKLVEASGIKYRGKPVTTKSLATC